MLRIGKPLKCKISPKGAFPRPGYIGSPRIVPKANLACMQALPFVLQTQSKRQLKADLEARLQETIEFEKLLQQEAVLVRM